MDFTLEDLEKHFHVHKEEASLLFVFLTLIAPGNSLEFLNGRIEKLTEETFKLCIDSKTFHTVADDFLIERTHDVYDDIFENETEEDE